MANSANHADHARKDGRSVVMADSSISTSTPRSDPWRPVWISKVAHFLLLLGATVAVFLAGVAQEGNLGAFLVIAGVAFLVCPPQTRVSWKVWAIAGVLLLLASFALLPNDWFPEPMWRQVLTSEGVPLPASVTSMPQETRFWLAVLVIAIGTGLFGLSHPIASKVQLALASTIVVICGTYAGISLFVSQTQWAFSLDPDPKEFGFFLNRNHTSTFLVTGSILALGILGVAFRHRHWVAGLLATACLAVCIPSLIFFTQSRGGVLSLLVGCVLWVIGLGARHRSRRLLISFGGIFLGAILLFLAPKSLVRHRIQMLAGSVTDRVAAPPVEGQPNEQLSSNKDGLPLDGRVPIFHDTLRLIRDHPLIGTGLGTFRYVFPFYRDQSLWEAPVIHPESDWLMLAAEAGIPALLILFGGIVYLIRNVWPLREHPYWPLRWGLLCAALAALLHGFVDVPSHRAALGWWILVICLLGFQTIPNPVLRPSRGERLFFVLLGFGACGFGVQMIRAQWFDGRPSAPYAGYAAQAEIIGLRVDGKLQEATAAAREAIKIYPMIDRLYYQLGVTLLRINPDDAEVNSIFRMQRSLSPDLPQVSIQQGKQWIETDPAKTASLWLEAVRRRGRLDRSQRAGNAGALSQYRELLTEASPFPALQKHLLAASAQGLDFTFAWLEQALPELVAGELLHLANDGAFLEALSESNRRRFLQIWYARGDREALFQWLAGQPDWEPAAWRIKIQRLTDSGKFTEAVEKASAQFGVSLQIPEPGSGERDATPSDGDGPASAFVIYWRKGNVVTARRVLDEARAARPSADPEIWRLSAALSAREGQWQAAWQHLDRYLRESHLDSPP